MTPEYKPLLDAAARRRRQVLLADYRLDQAADFQMSTPYQPGRHTVSVSRLRADVRKHLVSVEHDREVRTGELRRRIVPLVVSHGDHDELPWGLGPLVAQARVALGGTPDPDPTEPAPTFPPDLPDPLVPAHLHTHHRLVVHHRRGVSIPGLIKTLVRALPAVRLAVVCSRRRDVGHLTAALVALKVDARGFYAATHGHETRPPRVAVGTSAGLTSSSARATGCSVVIALDAVHFCGSGGVDPRAEEAWVDAHWLGLVDSNRAVSPLERDRLVCFFGPAELVIPAHGQVRREVVFAPQAITQPKGRGYERLVMQLASELAGGRSGNSPGRFAVVQQAAGVPGPVVVLADDGRHRRDLERELRPADRDKVRVVTPAELAAGVEVGVLVRADGRATLPPFADSQLTEGQASRTPLLVVDATYPDDMSRERAYRSEGWVSLAAYLGGFADWERWVHRRRPGRRTL